MLREGVGREGVGGAESKSMLVEGIRSWCVLQEYKRAKYKADEVSSRVRELRNELERLEKQLKACDGKQLKACDPAMCSRIESSNPIDGI